MTDTLIERSNGLVTVTFNRPERKNAVNSVNWQDQEAARAWLEANLERRLGPVVGLMEVADKSADEVNTARALQRRLYEAGYAGIAWPAEYGGQGLPQEYQDVFEREARDFRLPDLGIAGGTTFGVCTPTMLAHASPEFLGRHIPAICAGDELVVQFFSDPEAAEQPVHGDRGRHYANAAQQHRRAGPRAAPRAKLRQRQALPPGGPRRPELVGKGELSAVAAIPDPFEIITEPVRGVSLPVFRNRRRSLREMLEAARRFSDRTYLIDGERRLSFAAHLTAVDTLASVVLVAGTVGPASWSSRTHPFRCCGARSRDRRKPRGNRRERSPAVPRTRRES